MGKLGDMIAERRREKGLSVRTLIKAMKTRLSHTYMSKIELSGEIPTAKTLSLIAKALEMDENVLMRQALEEKNEFLQIDLRKRYPVKEVVK